MLLSCGFVRWPKARCTDDQLAVDSSYLRHQFAVAPWNDPGAVDHLSQRFIPPRIITSGRLRHFSGRSLFSPKLLLNIWHYQIQYSGLAPLRICASGVLPRHTSAIVFFQHHPQAG